MQQFRIQGFKNPKSSSETNFRSVIVSLCHTVRNIQKKKKNIHLIDVDRVSDRVELVESSSMKSSSNRALRQYVSASVA